MINVSTGEFYGPFDLLLDLIKSSKYDIYEVNLSEITNDYIQSIKDIDIPVEETADFILIASQLLYIKTRSLIKDKVEVEEEIDDDSIISEEEFLRRLIIYKNIKSTIGFFRQQEQDGKTKFYKLQEDLSAYKSENNEITYDIKVLENTINDLVNNFLEEDEFKIDKILDREEFSVDEYSNKIKLDLIAKKFINISHMLKKVEKKAEAIAIFLSILELSKIRNLNILQDKENFEITVELNDLQTFLPNDEEVTNDK